MKYLWAFWQPRHDGAATDIGPLWFESDTNVFPPPLPAGVETPTRFLYIGPIHEWEHMLMVTAEAEKLRRL